MRIVPSNPRNPCAVPQSQRCEMMPAQLAPKWESPAVSGQSTPNSVAMLGPDLSCSTPGRTTYFTNVPASVRFGGSDEDFQKAPLEHQFQAFNHPKIDDNAWSNKKALRTLL